MTELIQPIIGHLGATIVGPRNPAVEAQNPDILIPPVSDFGGLPNLKFPFAMAHTRLEDGGWAREVTIREMGVMEELAAVNMRLPAGVTRELHWHKETEWAYVLQGRVRFYLVDEHCQVLVEDLEPGDLWLAPPGVPHGIQGLEEGTEFLLVFNDGNFSENKTLLLTELFAHMPREVLAKNFGVPVSAFDGIPASEKYIFRLPVPGPLEEVRKQLGTNASMTGKYVFRASQVAPSKYPGGATTVVDSKTFDVTNMAALFIDLEPGGMREIHWHPDADELQYYVSGKARMTVFDAVNNARTFDFVAGDVGYVPKTLAHYIENTGDEPMRVLNVFTQPQYKDVSLNQWLANTPPAFVQGHLDIGDTFMKALRQTRCPVVKG